MGCVLLCAPEVDTKSYANPLKEGVHFFRVESPENALDIIASVDEATWQQMSDACRTWYTDNASVEGSFKVTMAAVKEFSRKTGRVGSATTAALAQRGGLKFETIFSLAKATEQQNGEQTVH
jgi:hypothetical protein